MSVLLEEYRTLRAESLAALDAQHSVLSFGVAAMGLFLGGAAALWDKEATLAAVAFVAIVPGLANVVLVAWGTELKRMKRVGDFLGRSDDGRLSLERQINALLPAGVEVGLSWEFWLQAPSPADTRRAPARRRLERALLKLVRLNDRPLIPRITGGYFAIAASFLVIPWASYGAGIVRLHQLEEQHRRVIGMLVPVHRGLFWDLWLLWASLIGLVTVLLPFVLAIRSLVEGRYLVFDVRHARPGT